MSYSVEMNPAAFRKVKKVKGDFRKELFRHVSKLSKNPEKGEKLRGKFRKYRSLHFVFRRVDYRVIYYVDHRVRKVLIVWVNARENLYKQLDRLKLNL